MKRIAALLIGIIVVMPVNAEYGFKGRLITTEKQRQLLDRLKHQDAKYRNTGKAAVRKPKTPPDIKPDAGAVEFNGWVKRSDGKNAYWINDRLHTNRALNKGNIQLIPLLEQGMSVKLPKGERFVLKPGQHLKRNRAVLDAYQGKHHDPGPTN